LQFLSLLSVPFPECLTLGVQSIPSSVGISFNDDDLIRANVHQLTVSLPAFT
jgi:hypothetical protein